MIISWFVYRFLLKCHTNQFEMGFKSKCEKKENIDKIVYLKIEHIYLIVCECKLIKSSLSTIVCLLTEFGK